MRPDINQISSLTEDRLIHLLTSSAEGNLKFITQLFPSPLTNEDSLSILSPTAKPYHELILSNRISTFDFRVYVFACRARLLGRLGRKAEGMRKGAEFVRGFGRWLEESAVRHQCLYSTC